MGRCPAWVTDGLAWNPTHTCNSQGISPPWTSIFSSVKWVRELVRLDGLQGTFSSISECWRLGLYHRFLVGEGTVKLSQVVTGGPGAVCSPQTQFIWLVEYFFFFQFTFEFVYIGCSFAKDCSTPYGLTPCLPPHTLISLVPELFETPPGS